MIVCSVQTPELLRAVPSSGSRLEFVAYYWYCKKTILQTHWTYRSQQIYRIQTQLVSCTTCAGKMRYCRIHILHYNAFRMMYDCWNRVKMTELHLFEDDRVSKVNLEENQVKSFLKVTPATLHLLLRFFT